MISGEIVGDTCADHLYRIVEPVSFPPIRINTGEMHRAFVSSADGLPDLIRSYNRSEVSKFSWSLETLRMVEPELIRIWLVGVELVSCFFPVYRGEEFYELFSRFHSATPVPSTIPLQMDSPNIL